MSDGSINWIVNFIWGIADDLMRDPTVRHTLRKLEGATADILSLRWETEGRAPESAGDIA